MGFVLKKSKSGLIAAGLFLLLFASLLSWVFFIASRNPADSGESAILLLPFGMPWVMWFPVEWLGPWMGFLCVAFNALVLYSVFGGVRFRKSQP